LAGAEKLDNGALFYKLEDKELDKIFDDEDKLRAEYDKLASGADQSQEGDEDDEALRMIILDQMEENSPFSPS
jgi:hypothetical protein